MRRAFRPPPPPPENVRSPLIYIDRWYAHPRATCGSGWRVYGAYVCRPPGPRSTSAPLKVIFHIFKHIRTHAPFMRPGFRNFRIFEYVFGRGIRRRHSTHDTRRRRARESSRKRAVARLLGVPPPPRVHALWQNRKFVLKLALRSMRCMC